MRAGPEPGWHWRAQRIAAAVEPPGAHQADLAELAGAEVFVACLDVVGARPLLRAHLADTLVHARRADDLGAFFHAEGERLLHVDVLAGVEGVDRDRRVPVVRRRDDHRVQPGHLQQLAMVAEQFRARRERLALFGARAIDVADRGQRRLVQFLKVGQQQVSARAAADERERTCGRWRPSTRDCEAAVMAAAPAVVIRSLRVISFLQGIRTPQPKDNLKKAQVMENSFCVCRYG